MLHQIIFDGNLDELKRVLRETSSSSETSHNATCSSSAPIIRSHSSYHLRQLVEAQEEHFGATALLTAAYVGRLDMVRVLVEDGQANLEATTDDTMETALHIACRRRLHPNNDEVMVTSSFLSSTDIMLDIVKYLIEVGGANLEALNRRGETPLFMACQSRQVDIVRYLVMDRHAEITGKAIHQTIFQNDIQSLQIMIQSVDQWHYDNETLRDVARRQFIEGREEIEAATPLFNACYLGRIHMVRLLVEEGKANVESTQTSDAETPLHAASEEGELEIVQYLCEQGHANVEATTLKGATPLIVACQNREWQVARYLLTTQNAHVESALQRSHVRAIHIACFRADTPTISCLVEQRGARVDIQATIMRGSKLPIDLLLERERLRRACIPDEDSSSQQELQDLQNEIDVPIRILIDANPNLPASTVSTLWRRSSWDIRMQWVTRYREVVHGVTTQEASSYPLHSIILCAPLVMGRAHDKSGDQDSATAEGIPLQRHEWRAIFRQFLHECCKSNRLGERPLDVYLKSLLLVSKDAKAGLELHLNLDLLQGILSTEPRTALPTLPDWNDEVELQSPTSASSSPWRLIFTILDLNEQRQQLHLLRQDSSTCCSDPYHDERQDGISSSVSQRQVQQNRKGFHESKTAKSKCSASLSRTSICGRTHDNLKRQSKPDTTSTSSQVLLDILFRIIRIQPEQVGLLMPA